MKYATVSDIGTFRQKNQDAFYVSINRNGDFIACVCDGVGGAKAGEIASKKACEYLEKAFGEAPEFENETILFDYTEKLVKDCNNYVFKESRKNFAYFGMATTITGIIINKNSAVSFNIGDSRVYGISKNEIRLLTEDDTLVNDLLKKGEISKEEALVHPKKHYLIKALGSFEEVVPAIKTIEDFEYYLICSDGLHGYLNEDVIHQIVNSNETIEDKCSYMLSLTLSKGGYDNITIVLVKNE